MSEFPKDFKWGVACASYQCEGAWSKDGKGSSIWDDFCHDTGKGHVKNDDNGDIACDSYHRYADDISLMSRLGIQAYRFSVSWPRVMPEGAGRVNQAGLDYYDRLIDAMLDKGIEPWVTLYHWDLPSALQNKGGWTNRATVDAFYEYAAVIGKRFNGRVKHYMTINEPQCVVKVGHAIGEHAPGLRLSGGELAVCYHHLALAHGMGAKALRESSNDPLSIGVALCGHLQYPQTDSPAGREAAYNASFRLDNDNWVFTYNIFMDPVMFHRYPDDAPSFVKEFEYKIPKSDWDMIEKPDFLGVNIYNGDMVDENEKPIRPPGIPLTAFKWVVSPEVMYYGVCNLYKRYGLPICVTENGQSCNDRIFMDGKVHDPDRIDFLHRYLLALKKAMDEGVPVTGYMHWSFLDNFEWAQGYDERFGLVYVDYATQRRIFKDSAFWYAKVIESNGGIL